MKKIIALFLSLVMLCTLTIPAFADEPAQADPVTAYGGVPGQINVMVNGKCVKFTDAAPETNNGRTMVPFRAIFEALGAEVSYDGKVHGVLGDTEVTLAIGSDEMTKTVSGKTATVKMDCAPYAKGGRTYVPVRFISEALGYDVKWDSNYNTAVVTDLEALAAKIDKEFTIYNKLMAQNTLGDKTQESVGSAKADVTLFDSTNGNKTGEATCSYDLAASKSGASGKVEYDFSALWDIIAGYIPMPLDEAGAADHAGKLALAKSLMKGSAELRMDLDKGKVYLSMPALFEAMSGELADAGIQIPQNSWLSASLSDSMQMNDLTKQMGQAPTMGKLLCASADASASGIGTIHSYDTILEAADLTAKLIGDAKFTRKGSADVLTITRDDLFALVEDAGSEVTDEDRETISKFDFTVAVKDNGDVDVDFQAQVTLPNDSVNWGDDLQVTFKGSTQGGKSQATAKFLIKDELEVNLTIQETLTQTDKAPEVAPPRDVLVLPMDGKLPGSSISSPDGPTLKMP